MSVKAGIAGAGIMGRLIAFALVNAGWQVSLFDNSEQSSCSMAAAGLLTPTSELDKSDLVIYQLGNDALEKYWKEILKKLPFEIFFQQYGCLTLCHPKDHAELKVFSRRIFKKLNRPSAYSLLTKNDLISLEPELAKFDSGYYFPDEAQIDSQALFTHLKSYLYQKGIIWHDAVVQRVLPGKIITDKKTEHFELTVDSRGLGAKTLFQNLRGLRGELIWLYAPDVKLSRPIRFLHPRYPLYVVPRPKHIYLVGSSELESEEQSPISVRSTLELLTTAYYLHPGFSDARILKTVVNCRPTLPHHLPQIRFSKNFIAINGLYRHGFLIAPSLAEDIMRWLNSGIESVQYPQLWEKYDDNNLRQ